MGSAAIRYVVGDITATAGAYAAGQAVGIATSLPRAFASPKGVAFIRSVTLLGNSASNADFDIVFAGSRDGVLATDKNAFAPTSPGIFGTTIAPPSITGRVRFTGSTDIATFGTSFVAQRSGLYIPVYAIPNPNPTAVNQSDTEGKSLIAIMVAQGTPTYGAGTLKLVVGLSDI
jgi:hypothetical protein